MPSGVWPAGLCTVTPRQGARQETSSQPTVLTQQNLTLVDEKLLHKSGLYHFNATKFNLTKIQNQTRLVSTSPFQMSIGEYPEEVLV